jgi:hypothetical protein
VWRALLGRYDCVCLDWCCLGCVAVWVTLRAIQMGVRDRGIGRGACLQPCLPGAAGPWNQGVTAALTPSHGATFVPLPPVHAAPLQMRAYERRLHSLPARADEEADGAGSGTPADYVDPVSALSQWLKVAECASAVGLRPAAVLHTLCL